MGGTDIDMYLHYTAKKKKPQRLRGEAWWKKKSGGIFLNVERKGALIDVTGHTPATNFSASVTSAAAKCSPPPPAAWGVGGAGITGQKALLGGGGRLDV